MKGGGENEQRFVLRPLIWYVLHVLLRNELMALYGQRIEYLDDRLEMPFLSRERARVGRRTDGLAIAYPVLMTSY